MAFSLNINLAIALLLIGLSIIKIDKRSGIINDPNQLDDEEYIVHLIGKIVTVSLETVEIVKKIDKWVL